MKRKVLKILITLLTILFALSFLYAVSATITGQFGGKDMTDSEATEKITNLLAVVLDIVRTVGAGVAILMLLILGSKYMLASAGERAEIKKHAITYVIGAIVLFAASGILTILKEVALTATKVS